jgi:hypothetical protein
MERTMTDRIKLLALSTPVFVGLLLNAFCTNALPGLAQSSNYQGGSSKQGLYRGSQASVLRAPVDLPDLPKYTARAYFLGGYDYPADAMLPVRRIQLKFGVHEPMDRVLDWYRDSLSSYSWNVSPFNASNNGITAVKGRNSCSVTVVKSTNPWFSAVVGIEYKLGQ